MLASVRRALVNFCRAIPFTILVIVLVVATGSWIGLTATASRADYVARYGYSFQHIRAGHIWVLVTMLPPWADWTRHVPAIVNFLILMGACEWVLGPRRTWLIYLAGHLATMLLVTLALLAWPAWCRSPMCGAPLHQVDSGTSVGVICCLGAVCAAKGLPRLVVFALFALLAGWLFYFRTLYAVEHLIAFPMGYLLGRLLGADWMGRPWLGRAVGPGAMRGPRTG